MEFEGLKHEVRQLREEAENARAAADETAALRRIAERQLAEALEALQAEREAKFAAKKELDAHLSREAAYNITNLAFSIRGMYCNKTGARPSDASLSCFKCGIWYTMVVRRRRNS